MTPPNLHSLAGSGQPLCVACLDCGHRATIPPSLVDAFSGNMKEIRALKLRCSKCESRSFAGYVMVTAKHTNDFMDGADLEHFARLKG